LYFWASKNKMEMAKIVILGSGESGVGAALLAKAKGFEVFVSDKGAIANKYKNILIDNNIAFEENKHSESAILDANEVVKSPGIPDKTEIIKKLQALKKPIISEIELAARYTKAKLIAITGSNGKTTTTLLTYHLLKTAGLNVGLAGNIGESFAKQVIEDNFDYFVLELSSFQLDNMYKFKANIAILLNITPDHLDRYNYDFEQYVNSKFRVIQNMGPNETLIYFAENQAIKKRLAETNPNVQLLPVALNTSCTAVIHGSSTEIIQDKTTINIENLPLKGPHNTINMMCALLVAQKLGINHNTIMLGLETFENAAHRLEPVGSIGGVSYINDSKATNVDSVYYALGSFNQPIVLIMGGVDKGNDYTQIQTLVMQKVKALVCMGVDNSKLISFFGDKLKHIADTHTIAEALWAAKEYALPGDIVLLSPACASFDLFNNYEDRGNQFRALVNA
jgi:UDP-N-acetylmuramoylalanine--D-glutamate ligase